MLFSLNTATTDSIIHGRRRLYEAASGRAHAATARIQASASRIDSMPKFFIGGAPKSGTTWLQLLLNLHPDVCCFGESHLFDLFLPELDVAIKGYNSKIAWRNDTVFDETAGCPLLGDEFKLILVRAAFNLTAAQNLGDRRVKVIGEKTPNNTQFLNIVDSAFAQAKFVHVIRDGRDCAVSAWYHNRRITPQASLRKYPELSRLSREVAQAWAKDLQFGADFCERAPDRYHAIRYEDLVCKAQGTFRGILAFLGVKQTDSIVSNCLSGASFEKLSGGRPAGQEDTKSFFRKGTAGDWRNHFDDSMAQEFVKIAGTWLERYGYSLE